MAKFKPSTGKKEDTSSKKPDKSGHAELVSRFSKKDSVNAESMMVRKKVGELPSQYISYPDNSEIFHRPYFYGEVSLFEQLRRDILGTFRLVLAGIDTSFPKENLTLQDFLYIGMLRKISTIGDCRFNFTVTCPFCSKIQTHSGLLEELEFDEIKASKLPVIADMSIGELHFGPLTVGEYMKIYEKGKGEDQIAAMAQMCKNLEFDEAYETISKLTGKDMGIVQRVDYYLDHGVKPVEVFCNNKECPSYERKIPFSVEMEGDEVLITPSHSFRESIEGGIRFGESTTD